jgi:hypothetical protein
MSVTARQGDQGQGQSSTGSSTSAASQHIPCKSQHALDDAEDLMVQMFGTSHVNYWITLLMLLQDWIWSVPQAAQGLTVDAATVVT